MSTKPKLNFLFYIKRTKLLKNGEAPIHVKIRIGWQKVDFGILKSVKPDLWDVKTKEIIGNSELAKEINGEMLKLSEQIKYHFNFMNKKGYEITAVGLKNAILGIQPEEKKFIAVFEEHNTLVKKLIGRDFAPATHQRYQTCVSHLQNYINLKYNTNDLPLGRIDPYFITGFEMYLKIQRSCSHNTTVRYLRNIRKIVKLCFANGWIKQDPFVYIKLKLKTVNTEFLSEEELNTINGKNFKYERLQQVADVFLFACFTGYAYSDLKHLTIDNLVKEENGQEWIHARRQKTDMLSHVPILPIVRNILDKYKNHDYCLKHNVLLPVLSNQKLNAYLKEIADICGITKNITCHVARHTFATTVTLNNDIPIESVSKMLGHSSISMTQNYAKLLDKKVGFDMNKIREKYSFDRTCIS